MHRAGDSDDGLAWEDAGAPRGVFGWKIWGRRRSDPGKVGRVEESSFGGGMASTKDHSYR
jgi:hypothetical protein